MRKDTARLPKGGHYFVKAAERPVKTVQAAAQRRVRHASTILANDPELARELRQRFED